MKAGQSTMIDNDLLGKVALVTGASRGLGASIAQSLGKRGAKVAVNTFGSPDKARVVASEIRRVGGEAEVFKADVRDESEVKAMVAAIEAKFGPVEILVCNATGPQPFRTIEEVTWKDCLDQLEFFVKSPILLTKAVLPGMKARRSGRIIQIGSEVFEKGVPNFFQLRPGQGGAASGLTRVLFSGPTSWPSGRSRSTWSLLAGFPPSAHADDPQAMKDAYASGRAHETDGCPRDDIWRGRRTFLASDSARFITGQKISVNGGNTLG